MAPKAPLKLQISTSTHSTQDRPLLLAANDLNRSSLDLTFTEQPNSTFRKRKLICQKEGVLFKVSNLNSQSSLLAETCTWIVGRVCNGSLALSPATPAALEIEIPRLVQQPIKRSAPEEHENATGLSIALARNSLSQAFGTKKNKQKIKAIQSNNVNASSIQEEADFIASQATNADELLSQDASSSQDAFQTAEDRQLPPFNLNATDPAQIYDLETVAPSWATETLETIDPLVLYPSLRMLSCQDSSKLKQLTLLHCMITFYVQQVAGAAKKTRRVLRSALEVPFPDQTVLGFLLDTFGSKIGPEKYEFGVEAEDRMLLHIGILYCSFTNWQNVPVAELGADLKISIPKLATYFRAAGFKVLGSGAGATKAMKVTLKAPISFPKVSQGGAKKRRG